jgi:hypothetical protein
MSQLCPSLEYFILAGSVRTSNIYGAVVKLGYIGAELISSQEINLCFGREQLAV